MSELLLQTISTLGKISIGKFDEVFNIVCQLAGFPGGDVDFYHIRRQTIRFLDSLGHCEFDFDRRYVFACPPALVTIPASGLPKAILTGARIPLMIQKMKDFIRNNRELISFNVEHHKAGPLLLPSSIYIEAVDHEYLQKAAQAAEINYQLETPAAWSLVNFSGEIKNIIENLRYENEVDLNWDKQTFSTENLTFSKNDNYGETEGLVSYINPINQQRLHWIWEDNLASEVDRDWGRYVILSKKGINIIIYDHRHHRLVVPSTVPLPRFLARAATLCTGLAPVPVRLGEKSIGGIPAHHPVDIYDAVPPSVVHMISRKLSQELIYHNVDVKKVIS